MRRQRVSSINYVKPGSSQEQHTTSTNTAESPAHAPQFDHPTGDHTTTVHESQDKQDQEESPTLGPRPSLRLPKQRRAQGRSEDSATSLHSTQLTSIPEYTKYGAYTSEWYQPELPLLRPPSTAPETELPPHLHQQETRLTDSPGGLLRNWGWNTRERSRRNQRSDESGETTLVGSGVDRYSQRSSENTAIGSPESSTSDLPFRSKIRGVPPPGPKSELEKARQGKIELRDSQPGEPRSVDEWRALAGEMWDVMFDNTKGRRIYEAPRVRARRDSL